MRKRLSAAFLMVVLTLPFGLAHASAVDQQYHKADMLFSQEKYSEAVLLYRAVLSAPSRAIPSGVLHTRIADCYFRLGDYQNALDSYRLALNNQKVPERPPTQYWIGFCAFLLGKDAEAVTEFLKIPELYPDSGMWAATAYYWAGRVSERMGKKELAAGYYRKAGGNGRTAQDRFALKRAEKAKEK